MAKIEYDNDSTGAREELRGSDNRINTSSRSDSRAYYNSRDRGLAFSMVYDHADAVAGEYVAYWQNVDSQGKTLVIQFCGVNSEQTARFKLSRVTGTAAGGTVVTPTNMNSEANSTGAGLAVCRQGASGDAITGLTVQGELDYVGVTAGGHQEMRVGDEVRLGQGDAVALECSAGATGDAWGAIFGYYE